MRSTSWRGGRGRTALGCVDCGIVVEKLDEDGRWVGTQERLVETPISDSERAEANTNGFDELPAGPLRTWVPTGVPAWEADHEVPLEDGGEQTIANLRCRCVPCHNAKTAREASDRARRRSGAAAR